MKKWRNIFAAGIISFSSIFSGCANDAQTGTLVGGLIGAGIGQAVGRDTEATIIGGAIGVGAGYLIGRHSDKKKQERAYDIYDELMRANTFEKVRDRIEILADSEFGNRDRYTSFKEREEILNYLYDKLAYNADFQGNRDGILDDIELNDYYSKYKNRPLVRILQDYERGAY